jgi:hypothetical protein
MKGLKNLLKSIKRDKKEENEEQEELSVIKVSKEEVTPSAGVLTKFASVRSFIDYHIGNMK